eukprot:8061501-Pyramimonas_sp.AAC.1
MSCTRKRKHDDVNRCKSTRRAGGRIIITREGRSSAARTVYARLPSAWNSSFRRIARPSSV